MPEDAVVEPAKKRTHHPVNLADRVMPLDKLGPLILEASTEDRGALIDRCHAVVAFVRDTVVKEAVAAKALQDKLG